MNVVLEKLQNIWRHSWVRTTTYIFIGLFIFGVLMDQVVMPIYTKHGEQISLPNITKIRYEDAKLALKNAGFRIEKVEERYDSQFPMGYVIEQIPAPGTHVKSGRKVQVVLSRGERRFEMPKLIGTSERESELLLSKFGLQLGEKTYEYSSYYPKGVVTHQSIRPNIEVPVNTPVNLTVSLGDLPDVFRVPFVEGRTLDDAKDVLRRAGLQIGSIRYEVMNALLPETVVKQSIQSGTEVPKGTRINLVVSTL